MAALSVEGLSKSFGGTQALKNVWLTLQPGEMVALIGASGSGKSTLIRHISGLERALGTSAEIRIFGRSIQTAGRLTREARDIRREVGVIFQQFNLVSRLPVITNVLIGCLGRISPLRGTFGWFSRAERLSACQALSRVGMDGKARQRASTLSGGQQQRAAIARALVQGARLLLADEPIASLDPVSSKRVMETLSALNKEDGITVLVSLHQVEYARRYCPRTIALRAGEIVFDGPSAALTNQFLRELYGDASEELVLPDAAAPEIAPEARTYRPLRSAGGTASLATA